MMFTNQLISLLLAMCMLLSPVTYSDGTRAEITPMVFSLDAADGTSISAGMNKSADGEPALFFSANGVGLTMTNEAGYVSDGTGTYTVPVSQLAHLYFSAQNLPEITEDDETSLALFIASVMQGVSPRALSVTPMNSGIGFAIDLDRLAHELHTIVPQVLTQYASYFDATLAKFTPVLTGRVFTSAELAESWATLGLDRVNTGLSLTLTGLQMGETITLIGSLSDNNFLVSIREDGFSFDVTTAGGVSYAFATEDLLTLAEMVTTVLGKVSDEAFSIERTATPDPAYSSYVLQTTTTIRLDTTLLAADLNRGLAEVLTDNTASVDKLLDRYRGWIALFDPALAQELTAAHLISKCSAGELITLPAAKGELTLASDTLNHTTQVNGHLAHYRLSGMITAGSFAMEPSGTISLTLACGNSFLPLVYDFDYAFNAYTHTVTLRANEMMFDLFNSITFTLTDAYDFHWNLTTDTNALRAGYSEEEQYLECKAGPVSLTFRVDDDDVAHLNLYMPGFFADLHASEYAANFDSTIGGFDYARTRRGFTVNGYLPVSSIRRATFGFDRDDYAGSCTAYLNTPDGDAYGLTLDAEDMNIRYNQRLYTITTIDMADSRQAGATIALDGEVIATLVLTNNETAFVAELFEGTELTAIPQYKLTMDTAPACFTPPADAIPVDSTTFLEKVESLF